METTYLHGSLSEGSSFPLLLFPSHPISPQPSVLKYLSIPVCFSRISGGKHGKVALILDCTSVRLENTVTVSLLKSFTSLFPFLSMTLLRALDMLQCYYKHRAAAGVLEKKKSGVNQRNKWTRKDANHNSWAHKFLNAIILSFIPPLTPPSSLLITTRGKGKLTSLIILSTTTSGRNEFKLEILKALSLHKTNL